MANDPLSFMRSGVLASMDTADSFFSSGIKMVNNVLGTFGLPQFIPDKRKETGGFTTADTPPLTFAIPTPQDIIAPVGKVLGAASPQSEEVEVF